MYAYMLVTFFTCSCPAHEGGQASPGTLVQTLWGHPLLQCHFTFLLVDVNASAFHSGIQTGCFSHMVFAHETNKAWSDILLHALWPCCAHQCPFFPCDPRCFPVAGTHSSISMCLCLYPCLGHPGGPSRHVVGPYFRHLR